MVCLVFLLHRDRNVVRAPLQTSEQFLRDYGLTARALHADNATLHELRQTGANLDFHCLFRTANTPTSTLYSRMNAFCKLSCLLP